MELGKRVELPLLREMPELRLLPREIPELRLELPLLREVPELRLLPREMPEVRLDPLLREVPDERLELPREIPDERLELPREMPELRLFPAERDEPLEPPIRELPPELRPARCASMMFTGAAKMATAATANRKKSTRLGVSINDLLSGPTRGKRKRPRRQIPLPVRGPFLVHDHSVEWAAH